MVVEKIGKQNDLLDTLNYFPLQLKGNVTVWILYRLTKIFSCRLLRAGAVNIALNQR